MNCLSLFPLEELELEEQKVFWNQIREQFPNAFDLLIKWTGWNKVGVIKQPNFFYYDSSKIRNLFDFFLENGFILNTNPQFSLGGEIYYHPQILDKDTHQTHRFNQQYILIKRAEQFLYIQGFDFLNRKANTRYDRL